MLKIPIIPLIPVLQQFAEAHNEPLNINSWQSIKDCFDFYVEVASILN